MTRNPSDGATARAALIFGLLVASTAADSPPPLSDQERRAAITQFLGNLDPSGVLVAQYTSSSNRVGSACLVAGISCAGSPPTVTAINFSGRGLTGIVMDDSKTWGGLFPNLQFLDLSHNSLTGHVPTNVADCTDLVYMDLSHNDFDGTPPSFSVGQKFQNLQYLDLSYNHIAGDLLTGWSNMKSLVYLDLSHNKLTGFVPSSWLAGMASLKTINLSGNQGTLCSTAYQELQPPIVFLCGSTTVATPSAYQPAIPPFPPNPPGTPGLPPSPPPVPMPSPPSPPPGTPMTPPPFNETMPPPPAVPPEAGALLVFYFSLVFPFTVAELQARTDQVLGILQQYTDNNTVHLVNDEWVGSRRRLMQTASTTGFFYFMESTQAQGLASLVRISSSLKDILAQLGGSGQLGSLAELCPNVVPVPASCDNGHGAIWALGAVAGALFAFVLAAMALLCYQHRRFKSNQNEPERAGGVVYDMGLPGGDDGNKVSMRDASMTGRSAASSEHSVVTLAHGVPTISRPKLQPAPHTVAVRAGSPDSNSGDLKVNSNRDDRSETGRESKGLLRTSSSEGIWLLNGQPESTSEVAEAAVEDVPEAAPAPGVVPFRPLSTVAEDQSEEHLSSESSFVPASGSLLSPALVGSGAVLASRSAAGGASDDEAGSGAADPGALKSVAVDSYAVNTQQSTEFDEPSRTGFGPEDISLSSFASGGADSPRAPHHTQVAIDTWSTAQPSQLSGRILDFAAGGELDENPNALVTSKSRTETSSDQQAHSSLTPEMRSPVETLDELNFNLNISSWNNEGESDAFEHVRRQSEAIMHSSGYASDMATSAAGRAMSSADPSSSSESRMPLPAPAGRAAAPTAPEKLISRESEVSAGSVSLQGGTRELRSHNPPLPPAAEWPEALASVENESSGALGVPFDIHLSRDHPLPGISPQRAGSCAESVDTMDLMDGVRAAPHKSDILGTACQTMESTDFDLSNVTTPPLFPLPFAATAPTSPGLSPAKPPPAAAPMEPEAAIHSRASDINMSNLLTGPFVEPESTRERPLSHPPALAEDSEPSAMGGLEALDTVAGVRRPGSPERAMLLGAEHGERLFSQHPQLMTPSTGGDGTRSPQVMSATPLSSDSSIDKDRRDSPNSDSALEPGDMLNVPAAVTGMLDSLASDVSSPAFKPRLQSPSKKAGRTAMAEA